MQTETPARREEQRKSPAGSGEAWTQSSSPTEVFDIGSDSDDIGHISSAVRALNIEGDLNPWHERSPGSSRKGTTYDASTAPSSCRAPDGALASLKAEDPADAWNVEDWDSHLAQLREVATPCRADLDGSQLQVANAVQAELQVDMETLVQEAMDEMRSWVSQEIAFARSKLEEAPKKGQDGSGDQATIAEVQSLRRRLDEQQDALLKLQENTELEKMRKDLQEQARLLKKLEDVSFSPADPRCATSSSERVAEARAVAEERKWRLRLETLESSLARNTEKVKAFAEKMLELEERAAVNDLDIQKGLSASLSAERHCTETAKDVKLLQASVEKQAEDACLQLEKQMASVTAELKFTKEETDALRARVSSCCDGLGALQVTSHELSLAQRQQKEETMSFNTTIQEVLARVAACKTEGLAVRSKMEAVAQQTEDMCRQVTRNDNQLLHVAQKVEASVSELQGRAQHLATLQTDTKRHDELLQSLANHCNRLESRSSKMENDVGGELRKLGREVATNEKELSTVQECLEHHNEHLADLDEQRLALAAKAALQEEQIQKAWAAVEGLESQAHADHKELLQVSRRAKERGQELEALRTETHQQGKAMASLEGRVDAHAAAHSRYDEILDNLLQQNTSLLDQAFTWDANIKQAAQRVTALEDKTENMGTELEGIRRTVSRCITKLQEEIAAVQLDQSTAKEVTSQLQEEMSTQVSKLELQQMHSQLQDWITTTRQAMDRWLAASLDKFQKEQGLVLERHHSWVHRVKRWIEQIHVREQGLSHVILHILQEGSPDMVKLLEEALKMPRKPSAKPAACE